MKTTEIDELEIEDVDLELVSQITDEQMCEKVCSLSSEMLADIIVSYKYMGLYKGVFVSAMQELASRRAAGETFNFEEYIESSLKELPTIDVGVPHIDLISQLSGMSSMFSAKK